MLIDGCLFDDCYASEKGGGFHLEGGQISVVNSLFYNNTAGSVNEERGTVTARATELETTTSKCWL